MYEVVFEAIPFCYGPASEAIAVANELEERLGESNGRIYGVGADTSYDLFSSCDVFDECLTFRYSEPDVRGKVDEVLSTADLVVSSNSPTFVEAAAPYDVDCFVVNTLHWIDAIDEEFSSNDSYERYYVPRYPTREGGEDGSARRPDADVEVRETNAIRNNHQLSTIAEQYDEREGFFLVNFGGMDSPLGGNTALAVALAEEIATVAENSDRCRRVLFNGGGEPIQAVAEALGDTGPEIAVQTEPRPPEAFLGDLRRCELLFTNPGLNIPYEALFFEKQVMFLPPMNYSQHLQLERLADFTEGAERMPMDDFEGYETLAPGLPEADAVERCFSQGERFREDDGARRTFRDAVRSFVDGDRTRIRPSAADDGAPVLAFDGAAEIASDVADYLAAR